MRSLCDRSRMKSNTFNVVNAQSERDRDTVTSQRIPIGLCASAFELSLCLYCDYVHSFRTTTELFWCCLRPNGAIIETSLSFYCVFIKTQNHSTFFVYVQNARCRMTFYNISILGDYMYLHKETCVALITTL